MYSNVFCSLTAIYTDTAVLFDSIVTEIKFTRVNKLR